MYRGYNEVRRKGKHIYLIIIAIIVLMILFIGGVQIVNALLNFFEFKDLFLKPFYLSFIGGVVLAFIAFFRFDFKGRRSLTWWFIRLIIIMIKGYGVIYPPSLDFSNFKMKIHSFIAWQFLKILIGSIFFSNALFGMALIGMMNDWDSNIGSVWKLFLLPFLTPQMDMNLAKNIVIPLMPSLLVIIPPLLNAIGARLIILVGLTNLVKAISRSVVTYIEEGVVTIPVSTFEALISIGIFWSALNIFFTTYIDYNTKVVLMALIAIGTLFAVYAYVDSRKLGILRNVYIRIGLIVLIVLVAGSAFYIQNSIADARKIEWLGPYIMQEIAVNRYLAELDGIKELSYNFSLTSMPHIDTQHLINESANILPIVRLWDWEAAFTKLKPEIGLIPYVDFEDSDILRFNSTLYWCASMKPILPAFIKPEDRWFNEHMVYTHVPNGFLLLNAHDGTIVDSSKFFKQRRIYYGEGGLFSSTWAGLIKDSDVTFEVTGHRYSGKGGVSIDPPLSWFFDATFMLSYPDKTIHILRYRDVYDRLELLYPYFVYRWDNEYIDIFPVTDGERTYWLVPLIFRASTENVPWSKGEYFSRFIGYALVDVYDGNIKLVILGKDFFSELFKIVYNEYIETDVPTWLYYQTRYPAELFQWRMKVYGKYHVKDPATFIGAREFFEVPSEVSVYYIYAELPYLKSTEFIGLLSFQLKGSPGQNLAGFGIVRNDYPYLGETIVYKVPVDSPTKLLGPTAAIEALKRDPKFKEMETLLRNPRIGDTILYHIGDLPIYLIPVYTAPAGGVVATIGTVAIVGAIFTGEYFIGLGQTPREAFISFLSKLSGATVTVERLNMTNISDYIDGLLRKANITIVVPEKIFANLIFLEEKVSVKHEVDYEAIRACVERFIEKWFSESGNRRIIKWFDEGAINYGVMVASDSIVELYYISITLN